MQVMELFKAGMSFDEFIKTEDDESYREKGLEILDSIDFSEKHIEEIKNIDKNINILIYGEVWSVECMINIPVIEKLRRCNKNINLSIFNKERKIKNSMQLEERIKLPTFIVYDEEFNELGRFEQFPEKLKEIIETGNESSILVQIRKYRKGKCTEETLEDILNIINRRA